MADDNTMTTYRRADGDTIGDYSFVTGLEWFESDADATELVEEVWVRQSQRTIVAPLEPHGRSCTYDAEGDGEWCDEYAVGWVKSEHDVWEPRCAEHDGKPQ